MWKTVLFREELTGLSLCTAFNPAIHTDQKKAPVTSIGKSKSEVPRHIQSKVIVSDTRWISPCKKSKMTMHSFQRYWWSKKHATWLNESILAYNLWSRVSLDFWICSWKQRLVRSFILRYFQGKVMTKFYENSIKLFLGLILGPLWPF